MFTACACHVPLSEAAKCFLPTAAKNPVPAPSSFPQAGTRQLADKVSIQPPELSRQGTLVYGDSGLRREAAVASRQDDHATRLQDPADLLHYLSRQHFSTDLVWKPPLEGLERPVEVIKPWLLRFCKRLHEGLEILG